MQMKWVQIKNGWPNSGEHTYQYGAPAAASVATAIMATKGHLLEKHMGKNSSNRMYNLRLISKKQ